MANKMLEFDTWLFNFINHKLRCRLLDFLMPLFTHIGGFVGSVIICLFLMIEVPQVPASRILGAVVISQLVSQMIKAVANRIRPHIALPEVYIFKKKLMLYDPSFPSAHTATVTAWATVLAYFIPVTLPFVIITCSLVGISRIYLGQHYPIDVFIGAFIGVGSGIIISVI